MKLFYEIALGVHIAAGTAALLVFWIPLVTRKGGRAHRRAGWVYVGAAATVAVTGLASCGRLVSDGHPAHWRAGIFLAYVALFAGESAHLGVRSLRTRDRSGASYRPDDLVLPSLLVAGGVGLAMFGVYCSNFLYIFFALLGAAQGAAHLQLWLRPSSTRRKWFLTHMTGMGTSCITTVTAFVVVNAHRLGMRTFDPGLWIAPIAVLGVGLTLWRRYYERRFAAS